MIEPRWTQSCWSCPLQPQASGFGEGGPAQLGIVENLRQAHRAAPAGGVAGIGGQGLHVRCGGPFRPEGGFVLQQPGRHRRCFAGRWLQGGRGAVGLERGTGGPVIGQRLGQQGAGMGTAFGQGLVVDAQLAAHVGGFGIGNQGVERQQQQGIVLDGLSGGGQGLGDVHPDVHPSGRDRALRSAHGRAGIVDELAVVALVAEALDFGAQDDGLDQVAFGLIGEAVRVLFELLPDFEIAGLHTVVDVFGVADAQALAQDVADGARGFLIELLEGQGTEAGVVDRRGVWLRIVVAVGGGALREALGGEGNPGRAAALSRSMALRIGRRDQDEAGKGKAHEVFSLAKRVGG